jgi:hypothetical protein
VAELVEGQAARCGADRVRVIKAIGGIVIDGDRREVGGHSQYPDSGRGRQGHHSSTVSRARGG